MRSLLPLAFLTLAACVPGEGGVFVASPDARAECATAGGTLIETRTSPVRCVLPTPDAGRACSRSTECAAACIATPEGGICGAAGEPVGCVELLDDDGRRTTFCID